MCLQNLQQWEFYFFYFWGGGDLCWAETMLDRLQMHHILFTVDEQL